MDIWQIERGVEDCQKSWSALNRHLMMTSAVLLEQRTLLMKANVKYPRFATSTTLPKFNLIPREVIPKKKLWYFLSDLITSEDIWVRVSLLQKRAYWSSLAL